MIADDHDLVAGFHLGIGHIDGDHVHVHRADDWGAAPADQYRAAAREPQVEAVRIPGRHDGDASRLGRRPMRAISHGFALPDAFHRHDAAAKRHHRLQRDGRGERRRHHAVHQKTRPDQIEPDA